MALFTTFRNEQKLFTKNMPEDRHLQIGCNQCHRVLFLTDHRVRQEFREGQTDVESHGLTQFLKRCFCQCEAMVPKVPVGTPSESLYWGPLRSIFHLVRRPTGVTSC